MVVLKQVAKDIRAEITEPFPRLNESYEDYQSRQSISVCAESLARYLAQYVFTKQRIEFLKACGVKP